MKKIIIILIMFVMHSLMGCSSVQQTQTGYEDRNIQNIYVYYNDLLYIYRGHNNSIEEKEISSMYKNYVKVGSIEKRSDKEMPNEELEAANIEKGTAVYANKEDNSKILVYTTEVLELEKVEKNKTNRSKIFEETFFENVVSVSMLYRDKILTDQEEINQILKILESVENKKSEEKIEDVYGSFGLEFTYENGDKKRVAFTGNLINYNGVTYVFNEESYNTINNLFSE